jgi:hypothetical protein
MSGTSRREFLRSVGLGAAGVALGAGATAPTRRAWADPIYKAGKIIDAGRVYRGGPVRLAGEKVIQPQREIPVVRSTDVLVVGGGPAGVIAALAARRAGVDVTLAERYGHFGGLWTGGLVLIVLATHARSGGKLTKCVRGIGDEMLERLVKVGNGIINQAPGKSDPTSDPEATKYVMDEMLREAGVHILLHSWATNAIMDARAVKGVVFESKAGCQAVRAKVVVDATGDGDVFGAAGAEHVRHVHRIGLVHRLGNVDRIDREKIKAAGQRVPSLGSATPMPSVRWVNMQGPSADCLDVAALSRCEMDARRAIWRKVEALRAIPGCEQVYLLETAAQLGVRISRTLKGTHEMTLADAAAGKAFADVVGIGGGQGFAGSRPCQIPYGSMVPVRVDNLLAAGRCVAADNKMMNYTRLIAPCFLFGHAAGAAAALAVTDKCRPRDVDVPKVQALLKKQGAYLG